MVEANEVSLQEYFKNSRKWEQDAYLSALNSLRFWRIFAIIFALVALTSLLTITVLLPLKTVEPFVIRVDSATGIVETMSALKDAPNTYDEVVGRYFVGQYVRAREGFVFDEAENNYSIVSLMSNEAEQGIFAAFYNAANPASPQNINGRRISVNAKIKSISFINANVAQVRYVREEKQDQSVRRTNWIATMTFQFVSTDISTQNRLINPLGFIVTQYRTAEEVL